MFIFVVVCYCYYVCEIGVWEHMYGIVLACWKMPPHIQELGVGYSGASGPYSDLRVGSWGLCVGHNPVSTCDG